MFSRLGERIKSFKKAWECAFNRVGFPELRFYDLRRSGVRNLSRAGVPERAIMSITGHKTRAMFDRCNIVNETDLTDAARGACRSTARANRPPNRGCSPI